MPSVGLNARQEPVNVTTSPPCELLNIHSAAAGDMLVQPCDTFWRPCELTDQGAESMSSPVQVSHKFQVVVILS